MTWLRFLDSPLAVALVAGIPVMLIGPALLFIGRSWGRGEVSEISARRLADSQRKVVKQTSEIAQKDMALGEAADTSRATRSAVHHLGTVAPSALNKAIGDIQKAVRDVLEAADQPTVQQRAKRRTA